MHSCPGNAIKRMPQLLAILWMGLIVSMVVHKGFVDISALAEKHSGEKFWWALAQHVIRNLAGG